MAHHPFQNPWPHPHHGPFDILRWKCGLIPSDPPHPAAINKLPAITPTPVEVIANLPSASWRITWLGHASFLIQSPDHSLLIDPVFSDFLGPSKWLNLKRITPPPLTIADLPPIDAILITHSHYDHLDLPTLHAIGRHTPLFCPQGLAPFFEKNRFHNVREIPWFCSYQWDESLTITATPAQHFSARTPFDRNLSHWCGFLLERPNSKIWHVGDSAYCPAFKELGQTHGPIDFAMIPIGAYSPRSIMHPMHMDPSQAVQTFLDARCQQATGMHWATFRLTDEAVDEPPLLLLDALTKANIPPSHFSPGTIGSPITIPIP